MHGLFLHLSVSLPVVYQVEQVRDGDSFNAVTAIEAKPIFTGASFQFVEEGIHHQNLMPGTRSRKRCQN
jgi:acyl-CoA thioesterase